MEDAQKQYNYCLDFIKGLVCIFVVLFQCLKYKGTLKHKCWFFRNANNARKHGVIYFRIKRVATEFTDALREKTEMSLEEKKWYCERGFHPHWKYRVGVTHENYSQYISYFEFYNKKAYVNSPFQNMYDDKLMTYYVLSQWKQYIPTHYFYISKGTLHPLDYPVKQNLSYQNILDLLKDRPLAAKQCHGGHGDGFHKFAMDGGVLLVDDKPCDENDFRLLVKGMNDYIITDFIFPSKKLRGVIGDDSFAVMRVLVLYTPEEGASIDRMIIRLGTKTAGHTQAGYDIIYANVENSGALSNPVYEYSGWHCEPMTKHPETNKTIEGFVLDHIDEMRKVLSDISSHVSVTPYLVMDIIPTDDSFSILEINSHGQLENFERFETLKGNKKLCQLLQLS